MLPQGVEQRKKEQEKAYHDDPVRDHPLPEAGIPVGCRIVDPEDGDDFSAGRILYRHESADPGSPPVGLRVGKHRSAGSENRPESFTRFFIHLAGRGVIR